MGPGIAELGLGSVAVEHADESQAVVKGAASVVAIDVDPQARRAASMNAELNEVRIQTSGEAPERWDLMLAADVLYETGLRDWVLGPARDRGPILLADPQRTGTPRVDFPERGRRPSCTFPDVDSPQKQVVFYDVPARTG